MKADLKLLLGNAQGTSTLTDETINYLAGKNQHVVLLGLLHQSYYSDQHVYVKGTAHSGTFL